MESCLTLAYTQNIHRASHLIRRVIGGWLIALLSIAFVVTASRPGHAESYPERLIKIVVPFPPGGPTDVAARLIAQSLTSRLGQNVVIENLAGAGGRIGARAVANAHPDGYTLLLGGTNVNAIIGALYKNLEFDPINSFAPVAAICVELYGVGRIATRSRRHIPAVRRLCKEQSRETEVRCPSWDIHPVRCRVLQGQDGNRHSLCALQRWRACDHRCARRAHRHGFQ